VTPERKKKYTDNNTPSSDVSNLETLKSTIELYKQQGKGLGENTVQSPDITPKSMKSWSIIPMTHASEKATQNSSNGGGDINPPCTKIDSSHKLPVKKKRKKIVGQVEEPEIESENMELETDLDSVFRNIDQPRDAIQHSLPMEIAETKIFDEDESFIFQSVVFNSKSKNLIIEKRDVRNKKGKSCSNINLGNMWSSQIS
jgi:hypothetical protein